VGRLLTGYLLNTLCNQSSISSQPYPADEYLDDLFQQVWKPIADASDWKNAMRRNLQRIYLDELGNLINAPEKTPSNQRATSSDAVLYLLQHLGKIEDYVKQQADGSTTLNALHYQDLKDRIKLIRDKRVTAK
jgi:hypothetical protein